MQVTSGASIQNTFSFGSTVDENMKNKLCGIKYWVHIFSGLFGSAVDEKNEE